mmetsp:Transcript_9604/g.10625  ORF Transcript_9604/g.10625 Transcript_9604/m.10625 type:complete len:137 (+) Transcript_9604:908-1318(+)
MKKKSGNHRRQKSEEKVVTVFDRHEHLKLSGKNKSRLNNVRHRNQDVDKISPVAMELNAKGFMTGKDNSMHRRRVKRKPKREIIKANSIPFEKVSDNGRTTSPRSISRSHSQSTSTVPVKRNDIKFEEEDQDANSL